MKCKEYSDDDIIEIIKRRTDRQLTTVYNCLSAEYEKLVQKIIFKRNKDLEAEILIQSLSDFILNIRGEDFQKKAKLSTYFYGIAQKKLLDKLRSEKKYTSWEEQDEGKDEEDKLILKEEEQEKEDEIERLRGTINKLSKGCQDTLLSYFGISRKKSRLKDLAKKIGITEGAMNNKKWRCMKKLRELMGRK